MVDQPDRLRVYPEILVWWTTSARYSRTDGPAWITTYAFEWVRSRTRIYRRNTL